MRFIPAVIISFLPVLASAERQTWGPECRIIQICDGAGLCNAADEALNLTITNLSWNDQGGGEYEIAYDNAIAQATKIDDNSPFIWSDGEQMIQFFLDSGPTRLVLHNLTQAQDDVQSSETRFLECILREYLAGPPY